MRSRQDSALGNMINGVRDGTSARLSSFETAKQSCKSDESGISSFQTVNQGSDYQDDEQISAEIKLEDGASDCNRSFENPGLDDHDDEKISAEIKLEQEASDCIRGFEIVEEASVDSHHQITHEGVEVHLSPAELIAFLRMSEEEKSVLDDAIRMRVADFENAQRQRHKKAKSRPFGIVGLYSNLSNIRADLRFAEDAANRRKANEPPIAWKEFERQRVRGFNRPYFTYSMIVICTIMMILGFHFNSWKAEPMSVNPLFGPSLDTLLYMGALESRLMLETNSWYRLITAVFLHAGVIHLLLNMAVLAFLGAAIEHNHGFLNTAIHFFVPVVGGNIISVVMQPGYVLVGASGGIFGLIGVCLGDIALNWKMLFLVFNNRNGKGGFWMRFCCAFWLLMDVVLNSLIGFTPFVDNFAHMGGLVYGSLISLTLLKRLPLSFFGEESDCLHRLRIAVLRFGGALLSGALFGASVFLLLRSDGVSVPCPGCRYISCIPFGKWKCDECDTVTADLIRRKGEAYYNRVELFCPDGGVAVIDIYDRLWMDASSVEDHLSNFCRNLC